MVTIHPLRTTSKIELSCRSVSEDDRVLCGFPVPPTGVSGGGDDLEGEVTKSRTDLSQSPTSEDNRSFVNLLSLPLRRTRVTTIGPPVTDDLEGRSR